MAPQPSIDATGDGNLYSWEDIVARKTERGQNAIPNDWRLSSEILSKLSFPLESHANRIVDLDIPRKSGILSARELEITENYSVLELLERLASGAFSSLEVTTAFCKRAAIAQQLFSCLTEIFFVEAIERAKALDTIRADAKQPLGPLHGLPISLKDTFNVKGHETSIGYVSFLGKKAEKNSHLVEILLELGAVLYVKTNLPQTVATGDSHNNIFGRTLNPHNTMLNAGGSTGGEGALVAFRGSPLGIGTDLAGSIRIPAACCGTYGFKPTASRLPHGGQASGGLPGLRAMLSASGPLANDLKALELLTRVVIDAVPARKDVSALDIPWRRLSNSQPDTKLRIGVFPEEPLYPLHPPVRRALQEATRILQEAGHKLVQIDTNEARINAASEVAWELLGLDPGRTVIRHITNSGEPFVPSVSTREPPATFGDFQFLHDQAGLEPFHRYAAVNLKRDELQESWMKTIWTEKNLDVVIGPVARSTAVPHDTFGWPVYTVFVNVLDYPACVIPFSRASKELDPIAVRRKEGEGGPEYLPDLLDAAPCSIQIFTSRFRDEECLERSRIIDQCLRSHSG
ncbi:uncharacterized protein A1O9_10625 [Exophiala aquamarina CBS 119918]|uniref:Amidase domain-containing protein n=1 Tax=Exophiala aquamarina CBS 119918 TaxID=1182545 RepID=A0A072P0G5_9EURO|nr:uncharacterized protein A1O9_10625 [Exophiala aquamarina CBS 119918]KEF53177.1 hypothetical protein A1O9_10625 [Exophiala aquamarina CBS 119918]